MFHSPYETTPLKSTKIGEVVKELKIEDIEGELVNVRDNEGNVLDNIIAPRNTSEVPIFNHPFKYSEDKVVVDLRLFTRVNKDGILSITDLNGYRLAVNRARLQYAWSKDTNSLKPLSDLPLVTFVELLYKAISSHFLLDLTNQVKVKIITAFYWLCLTNDEEYYHSIKNLSVKKISRLTNIPPTIITEVVANLEYIPDLEAYVNAIKNEVNDVRLEDLNLVFMYNKLGRSWGGINSNEIMSVGLEHPPTFIAMVASAIVDRSFKKTILGTIAIDKDKRGIGKELLYGLKDL